MKAMVLQCMSRIRLMTRLESVKVEEYERHWIKKEGEKGILYSTLPLPWTWTKGTIESCMEGGNVFFILNLLCIIATVNCILYQLYFS